MARAKRDPNYEPDSEDLAQIGAALGGVGTENNYEGIRVALNKTGGRTPKKGGLPKNRNATRGYTSAARMEVFLRRSKALELRRAGFTYEEIANRPELKYKNSAQVHDDIRRLLSSIVELPVKDVLGLELSRLDALTQTLWKQVREGDLASIDRMLRVMQHRERLLGLAQPVRHEVVTKNHMDNEIERLTEELDKMSEGNEGIADDVEGVPAAESYAMSKAAAEMMKADQVKAIRSK